MSTTCSNDRRETDVPELIPARMLNEFAYCPRLAYLEWVQGQFVDNLETIEGRFGHRRVDRPSTGHVAEPKDGGDDDSEQSGADIEPIHTRSLMLSAPREGLIANMDLVDFSAAEAVPVDYKRGRVPDVPQCAWEPERVQLCAHGLILRENGYHCEAGIIYYIQSRRRVSIPFDDALVQRTRELITQMRRMAACGKIPPPLEDSPKCPRCSLVGICLPDETCLLRGPAEDRDKAGQVRRLLPARQDALPLYVQEQGAYVGKSDDQLTVKRKGQLISKTRLLDTSQVCLLGNVQISAQALREITARGIPVCHFSYGGWFHGLTVGMAHKNVELRIRQFRVAADARAAVPLARSFVVGKIRNSRTLLRRHLEQDPDRLLPRLAELAKRAESAGDMQTLLGMEGMAAKLYFSGLTELFKSDGVFDLEKRNRRPPRDPVNALLSFVYAMLVKELTVAVYACGFDPMLGFFHQPRYGRPSLALDLAEEFRPLIGDSVVLTLINNREVTGDDFIRRAGGVALTKAGRRAVLSAFERRMETLVTHPIFGYRISYRRILEVQARLLGRTVVGEIDMYPSFCTR